MTALINLHRPKGFKDSSQFALNPSTGELLEWEWESLNPEDFSLDKDGNVFHNCGDKQSWSRVVRHGQNANNFFERGASAPQDPPDQSACGLRKLPFKSVEHTWERAYRGGLWGRIPPQRKLRKIYEHFYIWM